RRRERGFERRLRRRIGARSASEPRRRVPDPHRALPRGLIAVSTPPLVRIVEREALVWARLWRGLVFSMFVQPGLYLAAMGIGLGNLVDAHSGTVDGLTYLQFIEPGLLVASAMQLAASESLWPVLGGAKWMRQFHGVVATPIGPGELYGGFVLWTAIRAT